MTKKKDNNRVLVLFILFILFVSSIPFKLPVEGTIVDTEIDHDLTDTYGIRYTESPNICRGNNYWLHVAYLNNSDEIWYATSHNNGSTWTTTLIMDMSVYYTVYPVSIAVDKYDDIYILWGTRDERAGGPYFNISYVKSTNNGSTWSSITHAYTTTSDYQLTPAFCIDSYGNLHVVWTGQPGASVQQIRYREYWRGNTTWSITYNLTTGGATNKLYPSITVNSSNYLMVTWNQNPGAPSTQEVYYRVFNNATKTWGTATQLTTDTDSNGQLHPMAVVDNNDDFHVFWYGVPNGASARKTRHTQYNGATWTAIQNITTSTSHSYAPTATVSTDGVIHTAWHESLGTQYLKYSESTDNGATWSAPLVLYSGASNYRYPTMLYQPYPRIGGNYTDRPASGYCFVYLKDTALRYHASTDLTWENTPTPAYVPDYRPSISYSADTTTNGTQHDTSYININITSTDGNYNSNCLYLGTGETLGQDIFRYDGSTWTTAYDGTDALYSFEIISYDDALYCAINGNNPGDGDIYVSNTGKTWTISYDGATENGFYSFCEYNGLLYAGGTGVVKVFDGTSWTTVTTSSQYYTSMHLFGGDLYVGAFNPSSVDDANIYKFDGVTWTKVFDGGSFPTQYDWCYALEEYNGSLWAGLGSLAGNSGDVFNTTDGTTWAISLDATTGNSIWDLETFNGSLYASAGFAAQEGDIWRFNGTAWIKTWDTPNYVRLMALGVYDNKLWTGTYPYARIFSSPDGTTWTLEQTLSSGTQEIDCFYSTNTSYHSVLVDIDGDLLTWIRMDNYLGTTVYDNSTHNNHGTSVDATPQTNGVFGGAYYFDGDGDRIDIPTSASMNSIDNTATISVWANSTQDYQYFPQNVRALFSFYNASDNRFFVGIHKGTGGETGYVAMYNKLGTSASYRALTGVLPENYIRQWHLYTFVFTSQNVSCYIDGTYQGKADFTDLIWDTLGELGDGFTTTIGRDVNAVGTWTWYGYMDEFIISNRAFAGDEIQSLYDASRYPYNHNHTLPNANYTFTAYAVNTIGNVNNTETRWSNISRRYPPELNASYPRNDTEAETIWTTVYADFRDQNDDETLTVYWYENTTGPWVLRHVDTGVTSYQTISYQFMQFDEPSRDYYYRFAVNDSYYNITTETTHFTTPAYYFYIQNLPNNTLDWYGVTNNTYWCNATGTYNETLKINLTLAPGYQVNDIGVWAGDLSLQWIHDLASGINLNVTIPQLAIDACDDDSPVNVFGSVYGYVDLIIGHNLTGGIEYYAYGDYNSTLHHIIADEDYQVITSEACRLSIDLGIQLNASNISVQFSANNITWGANTQTYQDGGSEIMLNTTSWTIPNGCYGLNPFPIPLGTHDIYARFKLNLPSTLPSNLTYYSLSTEAWKIRVYSSTSTSDTLPPLHIPATVPATGNLQLKYYNNTYGMINDMMPSIKDVNGDGYMEIFWAGRYYNGTISKQGVIQCINGTTGERIWRTNFSYPSSATTYYTPITIYDFNKDGIQEVTFPAVTRMYCLNAVTGAIVWNVSLNCGWHIHSYIDTGDTVYIYTADYDQWAPYTGMVRKIDGSDGSVVAESPMYHSCNGGTSIADIDNDGKYNVLVTDRRYNYSGGGEPGKGIRCYDEDLNLLWYDGSITDSSHCAMLIDTNSDGDLEVITGHQGNSNGSTIKIYNPDGTVLRTISGASIHANMACGDIDNDGNIEIIDGYSDRPHIWDATTGALDYLMPDTVSEPPDIGNVILDTGVPDDIYPEVIVAKGSPTRIYKYNLTTHTWQLKESLSVNSFWSITQDIDHDGYNELILPQRSLIRVYETKVPATDPRIRTESPLNGERRLNSPETYPRPYYGSEVYGMLTFGAMSTIPAMTAGTFVPTCTSQHSMIELNGYYGIGNYTTYLNTTLYLPSGWTVDSLYLRIINTTGITYDNLTSGFTISNIDATHKRYNKLYNPSNTMTGSELMDVNVYCSMSYMGIPIYEGNTTFTNRFTLYDIDAPYNGTASYNTTTQALNMTWDPGNYTNRYIVVRKTGTAYPTTPTDGTVVQNDTIRTYNESHVDTSRAYSVFGYNTTTRSFSEALNIPWGAIGVNCYNESKPIQAIPFNLEVSNQQGTIVYKRTGLTNTHYIDVQDIPYGTNTIFILESTGYKQRIYYKDITLNTFYNYSFYLPPEQTQQNGTGGGSGGGTTDCTLRSFTNSINISNYTADAKITFTHTPEDIIGVEIFNISLYGTYGGWLMIPETKYTTTTTNVTINESVIDKNTSMARISYYYEYCPESSTETPLYYIRVVETIETEYTDVDRGVPDAIVNIKRYINTTGIYVSVATLLTDANGYCNVYLIPGVLYKVLVTKTLYNDMLSDYIPAPANIYGQTAEKWFRITKNETQGKIPIYETLFTNLSYSLQPTSTRHTTGFTVYYNITSTDNKLEWYRLIIYYQANGASTWTLLYDHNNSDIGGGSISYTIANNTGKYSIECWFKKTGYPAYEIYNTGSMVHFIVSIKTTANLIPDEAYFIITIIFMLVGMGACVLYFTTGPVTGYVGLVIMAFMFYLHDITINVGIISGGSPVMISGWVIFGITFLLYTSALFLWSRL